MPRLLVAALVAATLSACGDGAPAGAPEPSPGSPAVSEASPSQDRQRLSPQEIVDSPEATLAGVRVRRTTDGYHVTAWWRLVRKGRSREVIATSDDGFATATYEPWTEEAWYGDRPPRRDPEPPKGPGMLAWSLPSLVVGTTEGTMGYALGGDGATLFPFSQMARSTDHGETWTMFEVDEVAGQRGFLNGGVVLSDGRVLALLGSWSGDRRRRPSSVHHGLWASDGDDWGTFAPVQPRFSPALEPTADGWPTLTSLDAGTAVDQDVIWSATHDGLLYVSVDDGATFTAIPAR